MMAPITRISAVLLIRNGAEHLRELAGVLKEFDEVLVGDDGSTDDTRHIALEAGFRVIDVSALGGFAAKRHAVVREARGEWIMMVDADERPRDNFVAKARRLINGPDAKVDVGGYAVRFRTYFGGRWLRHGGVYPLWVVRLFRKVAYRGFVGDIHERVDVIGRIVRSELELDHFSYESTFHYIAKIQEYTDQEARELVLQAKHSVLPPVRALIGDCYAIMGDFSPRSAGSLRQATKRRLKNRYVVASMLPVYPLARFVHIYVLRWGLLDGGPGMKYAALSAVYSVVKYAKYYEYRHGTDTDSRR